MYCIFKIMKLGLSLKQGTGNREWKWGTGNLEKRESLKRGIFKSGNL